MRVAFIEPDSCERTAALAIRTWGVLSKLVVEEGANVFLFSNAGQFDRDCLEIVSQLKMRYTDIERHYYHGVFDYDVGYVRDMAEIYEKVHFPPKGIPLPRILRYRAMIDNCDVVVIYCSKEQLQAGKTSAIALAVEYANINNKRVINLF